MMTFAACRSRGPHNPEETLQAFRRELAEEEAAETATAIAYLPETFEVPDLPEVPPEERKILPLDGIPFLVKDLYDVAGWPTTASSAFLAAELGTPERTSPLVARLWSLGAVPVGKTHLNEFAYGLSGRNVHFGDCPHPRYRDRIPGGSSSGSAWGVGKGLVPLALGTDTGGSVRVPAAFCGLWGLRLTPGPWSRQGCFPLSPSLDTAGWFTAVPEDMAETVRHLLGEGGGGPGRELRGLLLDPGVEVTDPYLAAAYGQTARGLGLVSDPEADRALAKATTDIVTHYAVIQSREAYAVHERWLDRHREEYGPAVWARIDRGRYWGPDQVAAAETARRGLVDLFNGLFEEWDFVALPAVPTPAPRAVDLDEEVRTRLLTLTAPASLATLPVLTVPVPLPDGLSGGLQVLFPDGRWEVPRRILEEMV